MNKDTFETIIGSLVLLIAIFFFIFAYNTVISSSIGKGYIVQASFQNINGIKKGSEVMIAGVKVGFVKDIILDKANFFALLTITIDQNVKIPKDSSLSIVSSGLLGEKYILIKPGMSEEYCVYGEKIKYTQSVINIEDLIAKVIYSFSSNKK